VTVRLAGARVVVGILAGTLLGIGSYPFLYAKGYFYLPNHPAARVNWLDAFMDHIAGVKANKEKVMPHPLAEWATTGAAASS
jgi:hypothetical protein